MALLHMAVVLLDFINVCVTVAGSMTRYEEFGESEFWTSAMMALAVATPRTMSRL